ncbi:hypothetical protein PRIC2_011372 [Phytophthora ramorum]|uniref:Protein white n=1 Tax=Phytophthora ramorum TaxID=164328 RepID=UPI0030B558B0|nr:Protein white [Phytophthora ramorum]
MASDSPPIQDDAVHDHFVQIETPKPEVETKFTSSKAPKFTLQWRNINLKATAINPHTKKPEEKVILTNLELTQKGVQNFTGGFFFLIVNQTFGSANPVFISVPLELPIIIREYKAGLYHLFSWYLSKNVSELPMQILLPIVFFVPSYFLIGIGHGFKVFIYQQIIMILVNSCAVGLGYMVSCLVRRVDIAPIIGTIIILPFLLFGGLLINSDDCPDYFVWIQYVSPIKYGFEALMKIFWEQVPHIACNEAIENCTARTGADVLKNFSLTARSPLGDGLILLAINFGFRTVAFVGLWWNLRSKD